MFIDDKRVNAILEIALHGHSWHIRKYAMRLFYSICERNGLRYDYFVE